MRHKTKDKGDLGVTKTILHLLKEDIRCCVPLSEHLPFDLIAVMPDMTTLRRVQVKYRSAKDNVITLSFRSNYYDSKHIYSKQVNFKEIDSYAVYCPETCKTYFIRTNELWDSAIEIQLRLQPTKSGRKKDVRMAEDYADVKRIAPKTSVSPLEYRTISELDEMAIAEAISDLSEQSIQCCIAFLSHLPFDLIAVMPDMKTLKRVRIGYNSVQTTSYADIYAIYDSNLGHCIYVEAEAVSKEETCISIEQIAVSSLGSTQIAP
jgi:hypothetical protein